ncbi:MAG: hypothetical protein K2N32_05740, partial [Clostridia bacterium]|nr:hypothetical protein [Clostridia bacterium]
FTDRIQNGVKNGYTEEKSKICFYIISVDNFMLMFFERNFFIYTAKERRCNFIKRYKNKY